MTLRAGLVALGAAALVAPALALAGIAGDSSRERPAASVVRAEPPAVQRGLVAGRSLPAASCTDWNRASAGDRLGAVRGLTAAVAGRTPAGPATTLGEAEATGLLDRVCANRRARHFLLYEMYIRAAGFRSAGPAR